MDSLSSRNHSKYGLQPRLDHDLPTLFAWLQGNGLTYNGERFDRPSNAFPLGATRIG